MKRVKFMLLSLALFAVVGAALAFKAKYQTQYCTAPTQSGKACTEIACQNLVRSTTTDAAIPFVCTTTPVEGGCESLLCTTTSTKLVVD